MCVRAFSYMQGNTTQGKEMTKEMSIVVLILLAAVALLFLVVAGCYMVQQRRGWTTSPT
jgi:hypothetical protein